MPPRRTSLLFVLILLALLGAFAAACARPMSAVEAPALQAPATQAPVPHPPIAQPATEGELHWPGVDWPTAEPEARGIDPQGLSDLQDTVLERAPLTTSLLVIRSGDLVLERYYGSGGPDVRNEIYSCTKSFIATLAGIAVDQGILPGIDARVLDYFPGRTFSNPDPRKDDLTLEDLLTMTAGLDWTEGDPAIYALYGSQDWAQFMLDQPMLEAPGTRFNYCSGCSHLLSAVMEEAAGMSTLDYADQVLFEPVGISNVEWLRDSQGIPIGGWGLQLTPREMARLGYLYLRGGVWDGRQVVSREWVEAATAPQVEAEEKLSYGYQWWVRPSMHGYAALGRGGQMIAVIPEKDLVVVFTSLGGDSEPLFQLIEEFLIPATK
jgi:CubicO group peptidase (beta-lactamase class C family)